MDPLPSGNVVTEPTPPGGVQLRPQRPLVLPDQALEQPPAGPFRDRLAAGKVLEGEGRASQLRPGHDARRPA